MIVRSAGFQWLIEDSGASCGDSLGPWHETDLEKGILNLLPVGGVFLDVGAHVGHYTLRASVKAMRVIAVEANRDTADHLEANLRLNHITNVTIHRVAAWDSFGSLMLDAPNKHAHDGSTHVLSTSPDDVEMRERVGIVATAVPLDAIIETDRLDLVKLDVEGADLHALRGMKKLLDKHKPTLFIEDHSIYGYFAREQLDELLTNFGYQWENIGSAHLVATA